MTTLKETNDKIKRLQDMKYEERIKYQLMGNKFQRYFYFEGELFSYSSNNYDREEYSRIFLSNFKDVIDTCKARRIDTTRAEEKLALHEKELHDQEVNYYLDKAIEVMKRLEYADSNIKCTIERDDEVIDVSNLKVLKR